MTPPTLCENVVTFSLLPFYSKTPMHFIGTGLKRKEIVNVSEDSQSFKAFYKHTIDFGGN